MGRLTNDERYDVKVTTAGPVDCWIWTAATDKDGYGMFWSGERYPHNGKNKMVKAHRWGWERLNGPIPDGLVVCHTCDNPPCQNPNHWFLGTLADNWADCRAKGRARARRGGEFHHKVTIPDAVVAEIRSRYTGAYGQQTALAKEFGLPRRTVARYLSDDRRRSSH